MRNEFAAVIERDGPWYIAYCLEMAGANGLGHDQEEVLKSLSDAVDLILADRREDSLRGLPHDAIRTMITVG